MRRLGEEENSEFRSSERVSLEIDHVAIEAKISKIFNMKASVSVFVYSSVFFKDELYPAYCAVRLDFLKDILVSIDDFEKILDIMFNICLKYDILRQNIVVSDNFNRRYRLDKNKELSYSFPQGKINIYECDKENSELNFLDGVSEQIFGFSPEGYDLSGNSDFGDVSIEEFALSDTETNLFEIRVREGTD